jgi:hypothetical protein
MTSGGVGLPQVGGIAVSERVALRLSLPEVVVTCLVTSSGALLQESGILWTKSYRQSDHALE